MMTNEYGINTEQLSQFMQGIAERFAKATDTQDAGPGQVEMIQRLGRDIADASYILAHVVTANEMLMHIQGRLEERIHASAIIFGTTDAAEDEFEFISSIGAHHFDLRPNPFANELPRMLGRDIPF